jgi:hypothetical protein
MNCWAISTANKNPAQAAETSKHAALEAPIFVCTKQAVAGKTMSGVAVATRIKSTSSGLTLACAKAFRAAFAAMSLVCSSFAAMRRSFIPVRVVIHSSFVSTMRERSSFVSTLSGV